MAQPKYEMTVTAIGELTTEFIDAGILVFFGKGMPEELRDFAIEHEHTKLEDDLVSGDTIDIDGETYVITAVGDVASANLRELGHLNMKTNGLTEPELPGDVCVEEKPLPDVKVGTVVKIYPAG